MEKVLKGHFWLFPGYWLDALRRSFPFASYCLVPATVLTLSNLIAVAYQGLMQRQISFDPEKLFDLLCFLFSLLGLSILSLILSLWAFTEWVWKLSAFCMAQKDQKFPPDEAYKAATQYVKSHASELLKVWLPASLIMILPALPFSIALALEIVGGPGYRLNGQAILELPNWATPVCRTVVAVTGLPLLAYTMVVLSMTSQSPQLGSKIAWLSLDYLRRKPIELLSLSLTVIFLNGLVSFPQILIMASALDMSQSISALAYVWLGLSSLCVWPASCLPYLDLLGTESITEEVV